VHGSMHAKQGIMPYNETETVKLFAQCHKKFTPSYTLLHIHVGGKESIVMDLCTQMLATGPNGESVHGSMHAKQGIMPYNENCLSCSF